MSKTVLFQAIQFSISMHFSSIWPIDRTQISCYHSKPEWTCSNENEGVLRIPQSSSIAGTLLSDCLVPYTGHSLGVSYSSAVKQSVYSTAPADWPNYFYYYYYYYNYFWNILGYFFFLQKQIWFLYLLKTFLMHLFILKTYFESNQKMLNIYIYIIA